VLANGASGSCEAGEILIGAMCTGAVPAIATDTGARCGDDANSTAIRVRLVCGKQ
jgi:hypothetical protein